MKLKRHQDAHKKKQNKTWCALIKTKPEDKQTQIVENTRHKSTIVCAPLELTLL